MAGKPMVIQSQRMVSLPIFSHMTKHLVRYEERRMIHEMVDHALDGNMTFSLVDIKHESWFEDVNYQVVPDEHEESATHRVLRARVLARKLNEE